MTFGRPGSAFSHSAHITLPARREASSGVETERASTTSSSSARSCANGFESDTILPSESTCAERTASADVSASAISSS